MCVQMSPSPNICMWGLLHSQLLHCDISHTHIQPDSDVVVGAVDVNSDFFIEDR